MLRTTWMDHHFIAGPHKDRQPHTVMFTFRALNCPMMHIFVLWEEAKVPEKKTCSGKIQAGIWTRAFSVWGKSANFHTNVQTSHSSECLFRGNERQGNVKFYKEENCVVLLTIWPTCINGHLHHFSAPHFLILNFFVVCIYLNLNCGLFFSSLSVIHGA